MADQDPSIVAPIGECFEDMTEVTTWRNFQKVSSTKFMRVVQQTAASLQVLKAAIGLILMQLNLGASLRLLRDIFKCKSHALLSG
jgi:hypothetical protein